jgi:ketosteroid isomerase-like protein
VIDLVDRLDVCELVARFSHAVDRRDWDAFPRIFADDVRWEYPEGNRDWRGLAELLAHFQRANHPLAHHFASTVLEELPDGEVRAHTKVLLVLAGGVVLPAFCVDTCVRTPDGWRIKHRLTTTRTKSEMAGDAQEAWQAPK